MAKNLPPKAVRDAYFDGDFGFSDSAAPKMDMGVIDSADLELEARGLYAWARALDSFDEWNLCPEILDRLGQEKLDDLFDSLIDCGVALRHVFGIDEEARYLVFDNKMNCFWSYLELIADDQDVIACGLFDDYLESLFDKDREKLLSKVR